MLIQLYVTDDRVQKEALPAVYSCLVAEKLFENLPYSIHNWPNSCIYFNPEPYITNPISKMYLLPTLITVLTLHTSTSTSISTPLISPTCDKLTSIAGPKLDKAYDAYYKVICSHGCKPIVSGQYTTLVSEAILKPSVQTIATNLGIDRSRIEIFLSITDESMKAVEQHCSDLATAKDYCQDTGAFTAYAACAKEHITTVITNHVLDVEVLVSENMCEKELEYLEKNEFWDKVLPGYVDNFWRVCETW